MEIPKRISVLVTDCHRILLPGIVSRLVFKNDTCVNAIDSHDLVVVLPLKSTSSRSQGQSGALEQKFIPKDLYSHGTVAKIVSVRIKDDGRIVTLQGLRRAKVFDLEFGSQITGNLELIETIKNEKDPNLIAATKTFNECTAELLNALKKLKIPPAITSALSKTLTNSDPEALVDLLASMIDMTYDEKLAILSNPDLKERLISMIELVKRQLQVFAISTKLTNTVSAKLGAKQREALLREQLAAIKKELGESEDEEEDSELAKKIELLPEVPRNQADKEYKRMRRMNPSMSEYQVTLNYLTTITSLPWTNSTVDNLDIAHARKILDSDHYGMFDVKERIVEFLSVRKLQLKANSPTKGPIICLAGPPGVGKTSLGRSIATALGRKFARVSLGGVRDEADIRGHRRTYVGAMMGSIMNSIKITNTNNPVILLDEIDKISQSNRGDPSSALLEVLDPEQNSTFVDHYVGMPFDLSRVLFITTANELEAIPHALKDRMEIITMHGYSIGEKISIGRDYLKPKAQRENGLSFDILIDDLSMEKIITGWTREAGVRNLERKLSKICRKIAVEYTEHSEQTDYKYNPPTITFDKLVEVLGEPLYEIQNKARISRVGVVTGLAWTGNGSGDILFIESVLIKNGSGKLILTGKLGKVIQESAKIAFSWVKSNLPTIAPDISLSLFNTSDVHIHLPGGGVPKDGPSAGITLISSIMSMALNQCVDNEIAMTGEVTLTGQILPVGGVKEKVLAAQRAGIKRIFLPERNLKDLNELEKDVLSSISIIGVTEVIEVLKILGLTSIENIVKTNGKKAIQCGEQGKILHARL